MSQLRDDPFQDRLVVYVWLRHCGDFCATLEATLDCGGDTDTIRVIFGALVGGMVRSENGVWLTDAVPPGYIRE